jgi:Rrf2 family nitric oxide-sensitive transcriptional repressor
VHVSRKADYAVRSLAYLAAEPGRRVLLSEISQEVAVPQSFLSKIMKELVNGGLVTSQTGPGGGYRLARSPQDVTFRDILELVEGPWNLVPCQDDAEGACLLVAHCSQVNVWDRIRSEMLDVLGNYRLEDVKHEPRPRGAAAL